MKKIIVTLTLLTSFSSFADMVLNIRTTTEGISLSAVGVYAATNNSFFCTNLNGDFERTPKVFDQDISVGNSGGSNQIIVNESLDNFCRSELKGLSVNVNHSKIKPSNKRLAIISSKVNQDKNIQKITYKKFISPYGDFYAVEGGEGRILVGPSGVANAEISIEK